MIVKYEYDLQYHLFSDESKFNYDNFDGNIAQSNHFQDDSNKIPDAQFEK